jgi:hypothetical protein
MAGVVSFKAVERYILYCAYLAYEDSAVAMLSGERADQPVHNELSFENLSWIDVLWAAAFLYWLHIADLHGAISPASKTRDVKYPSE